jgi:hypothetical protein
MSLNLLTGASLRLDEVILLSYVTEMKNGAATCAALLRWTSTRHAGPAAFSAQGRSRSRPRLRGVSGTPRGPSHSIRNRKRNDQKSSRALLTGSAWNESVCAVQTEPSGGYARVGNRSAFFFAVAQGCQTHPVKPPIEVMETIVDRRPLRAVERRLRLCFAGLAGTRL